MDPPSAPLYSDLRDWLDFLRRESWALRFHPGLLAQQASAQPVDSCVAKAAGRARERTGESWPPWLRLANPPRSASPCLWTSDFGVPVTLAKFSPDGSRLVLGTGRGALVTLETRTARRLVHTTVHEKAVTCGTFVAPDHCLLTGGADGRLVRWDPATGQTRRLGALEAGIVALAVPPKGVPLVMVGLDNSTLAVWDLVGERQISADKGEFHACGRMAVSPVGNILAYTDRTGAVNVIEPTRVGLIRPELSLDMGFVDLPVLRRTVTALPGVVPEEAQFADGNNRIFRGRAVNDLLPVDLTIDDRGQLISVLWGNRKLTGEGTCALWVWDLIGRRQVNVVEGFTGTMNNVVAPAGSTLVVTGDDLGLLRVWDSSDGTYLGAVQAHAGAIWSLAASPDGQAVVSGGEDGAAKLWSVGRLVAEMMAGAQPGPEVCDLCGQRLLPKAAAASASWSKVRQTIPGYLGARQAGSQVGSSIELYLDRSSRMDMVVARLVPVQGRDDHAAGGAEPHPLVRHATLAPVIGHTMRGEMLSAIPVPPQHRGVGLPVSLVLVAAIPRARGAVTAPCHAQSVFASHVTGDAARAVTLGSDGEMRVWQADSGDVELPRAPADETQGGEMALASCAALAGSTFLTTTEKRITVRDLAGQRVVATRRWTFGVVHGLAVSPDRQWYAVVRSSRRSLRGLTAEQAGPARSYVHQRPRLSQDLLAIHSPTGKEFFRVRLPPRAGRLLAINPYGDRIASVRCSSPFHRIQGEKDVHPASSIWFWIAGRGVAHGLPGHAAEVTALVFSADGSRLISGDAGGEVHLWNGDMGMSGASWLAHVGGVNALASSADARTFASAGTDRMVRLWDLHGGKLLAQYPCTSAPVSLALLDDVMVVGQENGEVRILHIEQLPMGPRVHVAWASWGLAKVWCSRCSRGTRILREVLGASFICPRCGFYVEVLPRVVSPSGLRRLWQKRPLEIVDGDAQAKAGTSFEDVQIPGIPPERLVHKGPHPIYAPDERLACKACGIAFDQFNFKAGMEYLVGHLKAEGDTQFTVLIINCGKCGMVSVFSPRDILLRRSGETYLDWTAAEIESALSLLAGFLPPDELQRDRARVETLLRPPRPPAAGSGQ